MSNREDSWLKTFAVFGAMGIELAGLVVVGAICGQLFDEWLALEGIGVLIGVLLGTTIGFYNLFRRLKRHL